MLCFRKLPVAEKVLDKRGRGGGYHDFPWKIFCLRVPKSFVREKICAVYQNLSGTDRLYG